MKEITIFDLEKNFESIMEEVNSGEKYLVKTPDGEGIILTNNKDQSIETAETNGWIQEYKI
jgi:antitoxin (DNA-binding transcriptional repressor) of toxin-antitoxin stability system